MDEGAALRLDSVKGFVTHEKSSIGFCPLEGENALEIIPCGGEQIQVVGDILIIIEVIFCQEDGKLGLNAKAGAKGLLQKIMFPKRGLGVVVEQEHVKGQAVGLGKLGGEKVFSFASYCSYWRMALELSVARVPREALGREMPCFSGFARE